MAEIHGFDLSPPQTDTPQDLAKWERFLARIKQYHCFWNSEHVHPKANHIFFDVGDGLKFPKNGTKCRSFASPCTKETRWDVMPVIAGVWKTAMFEFGFDRARHFNTLIHPDGILYTESDRRSVYSAEEVAKRLEGVDSEVDVPWSEYGQIPDESMCNELAVDAFNSWHSTSAKGEEKKKLQDKEYFARYMLAKTKAWPVTKTLRMCHGFGSGQAHLAKLLVELIDKIEEDLIVLEGAPISSSAMIQAYEDERQARLREYEKERQPRDRKATDSH